MNFLVNTFGPLSFNTTNSVNMFYGENFEYFENFEEHPFSRLRLPAYLKWLEYWLETNWNTCSENDLEQIRIALSNNWELSEDDIVTRDNDGNLVEWIPHLVAQDPNTEEGHQRFENGFPTSDMHQECINDLLEGRFPPQCVCNMCTNGRDIESESMHRFLTGHQDAISLMRASMPGTLKITPFLK